LLGFTDWLLLAGLLYLGSGLGLVAVSAIGHTHSRWSEAPLRRSDLPWLATVVLFGGILGPALLVCGLALIPASSASLLLNVEALATMAIAWVVFQENVDRRIFAGALAILAGAVLLALPTETLTAADIGWGSALVVLACLAWGIDNNLTRKLSAADPVQIAMIKGLAAGSVNLVLALAAGARLPEPTVIAGAAVVGFFGYGVSLVLFVLALRDLGAARTGAYFSTAPFIGAVLGIVLFDEPVSLKLIGAAALMGFGVYLHLTETHAHEHKHDPMEHEHRHIHDDHHRHEHAADDPAGEPHSHRHRHGALIHKHPHYPDLHHRHEHA
jgi:drug/metabolite transporter (DMT)-like permease